MSEEYDWCIPQFLNTVFHYLVDLCYSFIKFLCVVFSIVFVFFM